MRIAVGGCGYYIRPGVPLMAPQTIRFCLADELTAQQLSVIIGVALQSGSGLPGHPLCSPGGLKSKASNPVSRFPVGASWLITSLSQALLRWTALASKPVSPGHSHCRSLRLEMLGQETWKCPSPCSVPGWTAAQVHPVSFTHLPFCFLG